MTVEELITKLDLRCICKADMSISVSGGYASDLLSDVIGNAKANNIWITLQTNKNVLAVADLKELAGIIFVKGLEPQAEVIEKAKEEGINLLVTNESTFDIAGKMYQLMAKVNESI